MAGVGAFYVLRRATSRTAFEIYAIALSFLGVVYFVSLPHVVSNFVHVAQGGLPSITTFALAAVLGTKLIVQVALFIGAATLVSLVVNLSRSTQAVRSFSF